MLLGPVAARLSGRQRLAIVADGALGYVPFAALLLPSRADGGGEPIVLHYEVASLPSAAVLAGLRDARQGRPPAPRALAVVAAAGGGRDGLPWSGREGDAIAGLAAGEDVPVLAPSGADRAVLTGGLLRQFRTVHFATHGVVDSEHPRLSGLVLPGEAAGAGASSAAGANFLYLQDVYDLELAADLVVLSGCRTALGREVRGEGLMGLARGFLAAGAGRVVASLWAVEDRATAELMSRFYRHLLVERRPPSAALRAAQIDLRRNLRWRDPYHWAGFVLVGDWQ
jgi:CHAT domain-containing protein